jgi:putative phosphoesterase
VIAVIGDTHMPRGSRSLPERCLALIAAADLLLHTGDLHRLSTLRALESIGPPLLAVHGNVDEPSLVALLPATRKIEHRGARIGLIHDAGPSRGRLPRLRRLFPDADAVVFGHSHLPLLEADGGFQIFNPGSPTERRRAPSHTIGLAYVGAGAVRFEHVEV